MRQKKELGKLDDSGRIAIFGDVIADFDSFIVIGSDHVNQDAFTFELTLPDTWLNIPVREVRFDFANYDAGMIRALDRLTALRRIHLYGHSSPTAVSRLKSDFPNVVVVDV